MTGNNSATVQKIVTVGYVFGYPWICQNCNAVVEAGKSHGNEQGCDAPYPATTLLPIDLGHFIPSSDLIQIRRRLKSLHDDAFIARGKMMEVMSQASAAIEEIDRMLRRTVGDGDTKGEGQNKNPEPPNG